MNGGQHKYIQMKNIFKFTIEFKMIDLKEKKR